MSAPVQLSWENTAVALRKLAARTQAHALPYRGVAAIDGLSVPLASLLAGLLKADLVADVTGGDVLVVGCVASQHDLRLMDRHRVPTANYDALYRHTEAPPMLAPRAPTTNRPLRFPWDQSTPGLHDSLAGVFAHLGHPDPDRHQATPLFDGFRPDPSMDPAGFLTDVDRVSPERRAPIVYSRIGFVSLHAETLAPMTGAATIAYVPNRDVGAAKPLAVTRMVQGYGQRLQTQPYLTEQILGAVLDRLGTGHAAVITTVWQWTLDPASTESHQTALHGDTTILDLALQAHHPSTTRKTNPAA